MSVEEKMAAAPKKNRLSIYLIKDEYSGLEKIFKDLNNYKHVKAKNDMGTFYYKGSPPVNVPAGIKNFFGNNSLEKPLKELGIWSTSASAVFLISIDVGEEVKYFAITFGYGHTMLRPGAAEERFGLKVALNWIDLDKLKAIDKRSLSVIPKDSREQTIKAGGLNDFGIDVEQDILKGVMGEYKNKKKEDESNVFGKMIIGKESLTISAKIDILEIKDLLKRCYTKYQGKYPEGYECIENILPIKDKYKIKELSDNLVDKINKKDLTKIWMAVPEIIDWEAFDEFKLSKESLGNDINLRQYLEIKGGKISLETLHKDNIVCVSETDEKKSWEAYHCIYAEIKDKDNELHILSSSSWHKVDTDFVAKIENTFKSLRDKPEKNKVNLSFPVCGKDEHELAYNKRVAKKLGLHCMDSNLINCTAPRRKIEFCDLLTKNQEIIHVKHYGSSSVLSHLFGQGLVSGEMLHGDKEFLIKLKKKLPEEYQIKSEDIVPRDYKVVFAIISDSNKELDVPFFTKVNLKNVEKNLKHLGYNVNIIKIPKERPQSTPPLTPR